MSQTWKKPVSNIVLWVQIYCSHGKTVSQLHTGIYEPYVDGDEGRLYDKAYREKMSSTGNRAWAVALYQELCGSRPRRKVVADVSPCQITGEKAPLGWSEVAGLLAGTEVLVNRASSITDVLG